MVIMPFLPGLFGYYTSSLRKFLDEGAVIIDVRTPQEFNSGHIKGSKNIPMEMLKNRVEEVKQFNKPVIVVCHSGRRSGSASSFLEAKGIRAMNGGSWAALNNIV